MGSTLNRAILSIAGSKGGVGCSTLTALISLIFAKNKNLKIAVIDRAQFQQSMLFAYLPLSTPAHSLDQLLPYSSHLNSKLIEKYFTSSDNLSYIPITQSNNSIVKFEEILNLISKISEFFDYTIIDLSSFSHDQQLNLFELSKKNIIVASLEHSSLVSLGKTEKRLSDFHLNIKKIDVLFNQTQQTQTNPKEPQTLSKNLNYVGIVPFLGNDLSFDLLEKKPIQPSVEKNLSVVINNILNSQEKPESQPVSSTTPETDNSKITPKISLQEIHELHQKLLENLRKSGVLKESQKSSTFHRETLEPQAKEILNSLIAEMNIENRETKQYLISETLNLAFGLGPLEHLLQNDEISEIMANGAHQIYVEKRGRLELSDVRFIDDQQLRTSIERILSPIGRRLDESQPYVDGRLLDGSRVNAVIPPVSLNGPILTIRKFSKNKLTVADLIRFGSLTPEAADFLGACVKARKNIVVSGGTGSGKTTLLNILSNFIPSSERIVTIEDSAELQLSQDHVVRLESRPANLEGKGHISIRDLVINALRMRPDRIVVGECRGGEALDMLQAMNTGHDGSMTTAHANTARDVISRLETMCLFAGVDLPLKAIREQISRAVEVVVQQTRLPDGKRSVTQISEVQGMEGDVIVLQDIFVYEKEKGLVRQPFTPSFIKSLNAIGYQWPGKH
jgi:pilus assembly protein CpaF